jgi:hypothetical protein
MLGRQLPTRRLTQSIDGKQAPPAAHHDGGGIGCSKSCTTGNNYAHLGTGAPFSAASTRSERSTLTQLFAGARAACTVTDLLSVVSCGGGMEQSKTVQVCRMYCDA